MGLEWHEKEWLYSRVMVFRLPVEPNMDMRVRFSVLLDSVEELRRAMVACLCSNSLLAMAYMMNVKEKGKKRVRLE